MSENVAKDFLEKALSTSSLRAKWQKPVVLDDENTVGASDGYRIHIVRDSSYSVEADPENAEKSKAVWGIVAKLDRETPQASVDVNVRFLLDALNNLKTPVTLTVYKNTLTIQGQLDDDEETDAYAVIMGMAFVHEPWKPNLKNAQLEFDTSTIGLAAVAP